MPTTQASAPRPPNEPVKGYAPGSPERADLKAALTRVAAEPVELPMWIDGKDVRTSTQTPMRSPHDHGLVLGHSFEGGPEHVDQAIAAATAARPAWSSWSQAERSSIFLRAAELAATTHRQRLNASTMLGQSKTAYQAEIDAACEWVDFLRFNAYFASQLGETLEQPAGIWNALEMRPLEGFVCAVTPFNFTAIAGNLPTAPALLGNVVVWKPSPLAMRSAYEVVALLKKAGLPDGVINLVQGPAEAMVGRCLEHRDFAGLHFTGSTQVFRRLLGQIGQNAQRYRGYPRVVGETGGKDFIFAHESADLEALAIAMCRGAYEYQGQKCSAASRAYVPRSIWNELSERLIAHIESIRVGDVRDFTNLMGAVIDERAFERLSGAIAEAKQTPGNRLIAGGKTDKSVGYFVHPTLVACDDPRSRLMKDEFFGPLLAVHIYDDETQALSLCDESNYALTGAVFGRDRAFLSRASHALRDAAGNFYINDKPTGAVVAQQPFGGARGSGTNDKAGSALNLWRWVSPRSVKETFVPATSLGYPSMLEP